MKPIDNAVQSFSHWLLRNQPKVTSQHHPFRHSLKTGITGNYVFRPLHIQEHTVTGMRSIVELVDSNVRTARTRNIIMINKISQNLKNSKPITIYRSLNNMPSGMKKHHKSNEPESRQTAKMFLLLLRRASSNLHDSQH